LGLNEKNKEYLNLAARGAFMYTTATHAKTILMNILNDLPEEKVESIAKSESLLESQPLAILKPELLNEKEEIPFPDFML